MVLEGCIAPASALPRPEWVKNGGYLWGRVRAFQQVSSTPMNGLMITLAPFKIWLCATEA